MVLMMLMDLIVAGISLMIGLGFFAFIASILCSVAFFHHARAVVDHQNQYRELNKEGKRAQLVQ